ncbi:zinc finger protein rotund-like [Contarinia nasturtii]|uniref:zinc finger protein rotund-like n=1 Tax=Contarinia nasturtii TaxID=265458 RepID=UPI0012D45856|nr:zinc finger protein rotund-like [Contarinia nasturtii]
MALNTPKRIKLFDTFVQSPGSDHNVEWPDSFDDDTSTTPTMNLNKSLSTSANRNDTANGNGSLSPVSSCDSPEFSLRNNSNTSSNISTSSHNNTPNASADGRENRRGRPRSEALTHLMIEGSTSPSSIKCTFCNRVFPREKSLQAHLRTHTGEKPYQCDYPGCTRAFTQSGQLKTHQRLHTGERPFMCSAPKCQMRFTHANRHCPEHPYEQLKRCDGYVIAAVTEPNHEVTKWLEKYKMEKEDRTPTRKTPKRTKTSHSDDNSMRTSSITSTTSSSSSLHRSSEKSNENFNTIGGGSDENQFTPVTPNNPYKVRKGLMTELDMNAGLGASPITGTKMKPTPKVIRWHEPLSQEEDSADEFENAAQSAFNPKKRWLREAWQNDLARPLEPITNGRSIVASSDAYKTNDKHSTPYQMLSPLKQQQQQPHQQQQQHKSYTTMQQYQQHINNDTNQMNPNQLRPTVLMVASKDRAMPLTNLTTNANGNHMITSNTTSNKSQLQAQQPTSNINILNSHVVAVATDIATATPISSSNPVSNECFDLQQKHRNEIESDLRLDPKYVIASTPIAISAQSTASVNHSSSNSNGSSNSNEGTNRKWLGALALMELATEPNQVSSTLPLVYENSTTN